MAVLYTFREPSLCRQVHRELMRSALLDLTPIIPATACHQRNYVERYSRSMEVAIHLPDDVAASVPWEDVPRHILEQIALEGYGEGWLSEEQVRRLLGYETRLDVHGFLKDHGVYLRYTVEDLERDRATHERLGL